MSTPEKLLKQGLCNRLKSPLLIEEGAAILTDRRFIYGKTTLATAPHDLILPLEELTAISQGRHGLSRQVLELEAGGQRYRFLVRDYQEWAEALQAAINAPPAPPEAAQEAAPPPPRCPQCGQELAGWEAFCPQCGQPLEP